MATVSSADPVGTPQPIAKKALDVPEIQQLFKTNKEEYIRRSDLGSRVQARKATKADAGSNRKLITWVTDNNGNFIPECVKIFTPEEIKKGIYILRYPKPLSEERAVYNEWYITVDQWRQQYHGDPSPAFASFAQQKPSRKQGILITEKVIEVLGGKDGIAEVLAPWGERMYAMEGGLLTEEGSCIGPAILKDYYEKKTNPHTITTVQIPTRNEKNVLPRSPIVSRKTY